MKPPMYAANTNIADRKLEQE